MVQFSATAYSPRLVIWLARDPVLFHSLGVFIATFCYAVAALAWTDRGGSGKVPFFSAMLVIGLLIVTSVFGLVGIGAAVILHEGSTIVVVLNALRLLAYRK